MSNLINQNTRSSVKGAAIKKLSDKEIDAMITDEHVALAIKSNLAVIRCLEQQIEKIKRITAVRG